MSANFDSERLRRLADKVDLDALLAQLDALPADRLHALLNATNGAASPEPEYTPPAPDADFYGFFDRHLTDEQQRIRRTVRTFMLEEVEPVINDYWDRGAFPFELVEPLGAMLADALGDDPARRYSRDPLTAGLVGMEVARVEPSIGTFLGVHWGLALISIVMFGSEAQQDKWLGPMARFERIGSWALTEPDHGSDASAGLEATATRSGDTWTLNGAKKWSGNATFADVTVIWARDTADGQVKGFLVEKGTPGFHVEKLGGKIAKRAVDNVEIRLEDVTIHEADRLPGVNSFRDAVGTRPRRGGVGSVRHGDGPL